MKEGVDNVVRTTRQGPAFPLGLLHPGLGVVRIGPPFAAGLARLRNHRVHQYEQVDTGVRTQTNGPVKAPIDCATTTTAWS